MSASENDVIENVDNGNVALIGNETAKASQILMYEFHPDYSKWLITKGNMSGSVVLPAKRNYDPENPPKMTIKFRQGSYFECAVYITYLDEPDPEEDYFISSMSFNWYFMLYDEPTDSFTKINLGSISPMTRKTIINEEDPEDPHMFYIFKAGNELSYGIMFWENPLVDGKIRQYIMAKRWGYNNEYTYDIYWNNLNYNLMTDAMLAPISLSETTQPLFDFLAGEASGHTEYPGDDSQSGGGDGSFYNQNDPVGLPSVPSLQAIDLGFTTLYNPSPADVRQISQWLWSADFNDNILMNYSDPLNNILGINFLPVDAGVIPQEDAYFTIGNVASSIRTKKIPSGNKNQYLEVSCGICIIPEYWQNFLDYNTTFQIWLPFIGFRTLKPEEVLQATEDSGGYLAVDYLIDLLTGAAVCSIRSFIPERLNPKNVVEHLLYSYNCNVFYSTPLSGANYMSQYNQQLNATATGINNMVSGAKQIASGDIVGGFTNIFTGQQQAKREYETAKPEYGRSGNSGGNTGYFSYKIPYIIKCQPVGQTPKNYKSLQGIPSQIYSKLSKLTGYTEIDRVITDTLTSCTSEEKEEIIRMLKNGVVL